MRGGGATAELYYQGISDKLKNQNISSRLFYVLNFAERLTSESGIHLPKNAFTLAEVLITLGIIGIVAAMTLPAVINKYQERATVTKVKKFYSTMNQAFLMAIGKSGYVEDWEYADGAKCPEGFARNLVPELKIARNCKCGEGCISTTYSYLNGSNRGMNYDAGIAYYKMVLLDGSYLWFRDSMTRNCNAHDGGFNNVCGMMWYDLNGPKEPNKYGVDLFVFLIMKDRILPDSFDDCDPGSGKDYTGWGCSRYILEHDNMEYYYK